MNAIIRTWRNYRRGRSADERGAVFVFTAICMVVLLWAGAMGVDVGFSVWGSRTAQAMADTAALDLAALPGLRGCERGQPGNGGGHHQRDTPPGPHGQRIRRRIDRHRREVDEWGLDRSRQFRGTVDAPRASPAATRSWSRQPRRCPRSSSGASTLSAPRSAIAANTPEAGFSIGTFLANVDTQQSATLNAILGSVGSANLTLVGYQGVATSYVTLNQLISADSTVLSPTNILSYSMTPQGWSSVLETALGKQINGVNCNGANPPARARPTTRSSTQGDRSRSLEPSRSSSASCSGSTRRRSQPEV